MWVWTKDMDYLEGNILRLENTFKISTPGSAQLTKTHLQVKVHDEQSVCHRECLSCRLHKTKQALHHIWPEF